MNLKWNLNSKKKNKNELITVNKLKRLIGNARGGWKNLITIEWKFCIVVTSESVSEHKSIFISLSTCIFFTTSENQNFSLHCSLVDVRALIWLVLRWKTTQTFPSIFIFYFFLQNIPHHFIVDTSTCHVETRDRRQWNLVCIAITFIKKAKVIVHWRRFCVTEQRIDVIFMIAHSDTCNTTD